MHKHTHQTPQSVLASGSGPGKAERYRETVKVTLIGAVIDLLLGVVKIIVGGMAHSQALIADGVHSLSDLVTDGLVLYAAKHGSREADEEHPYGHGRIETVATVALGIALIAVAFGIAYDSVLRLREPGMLIRPDFIVLIVAGISVVAKELIYRYTMHIARRYRSEMLKANAWHSRSDAISSVVVLIGVGGSMAGFVYLDAIAAVIVALMIAKIGWDLSWHSLRELVDTALDKERVEDIEKAILTVDGVMALHLLRTRRMGGDALVDVHIQVNPEVSVSEGHQISEIVRQRVMKEIAEVCDVTVHIDPEDDSITVLCADLPLRGEVMRRLALYFKDCKEVSQMEDVILHYLSGKIDIDLFLPWSSVASMEEAIELKKRLQAKVADDPDIGYLDVVFH